MVALDAYCAHMGAHLAEGRVEGNALRCFFHRWRYDADGRCSDVPCLDGAPTPRMRVRAWPTAERHGLVWVWTGETPAHDVPEVPELAGAPVRCAGRQPLRQALPSQRRADQRHRRAALRQRAPPARLDPHHGGRAARRVEHRVQQRRPRADRHCARPPRRALLQGSAHLLDELLVRQHRHGHHRPRLPAPVPHVRAAPRRRRLHRGPDPRVHAQAARPARLAGQPRAAARDRARRALLRLRRHARVPDHPLRLRQSDSRRPRGARVHPPPRSAAARRVARRRRARTDARPVVRLRVARATRRAAVAERVALVTGCSSGFGLGVARALAARGWSVTATMRDPSRAPAALAGRAASRRSISRTRRDRRRWRRASRGSTAW